MSLQFRHVFHTLAPTLTLAAMAAASQGADYSSAASYNSPYGLSAGAENQAVNPSLRDANGNLTVVNGQFTSSAFSQQTGVQSMGTISSGSLASLGTTSGGVGNSTAGATAIGNSLNVVTVGSNNTVVVNSTQTNNGNQNASVSVNGR
ncbi:MAG: holdfast anchoring protein HfaA [Alphaproteobacteria bacterium]|nr:holdfast anchoring protein HfaA [Alphaproteobacteria bacterium]